jgi:MraZ protein
MVFTGRFDHIIDDKGRLAIPSPMRNQVRPELHGDGFYLVQEKRYLQLVPAALFEHLASSVKAALMPTAKVAKASRYFFSGVFKLDPDKQGRVMIPDGFMKDSKNPDPLARTLLNHEVTLVGNGDRIEIWNRAAFLAHMTEANEDVDSFIDVLIELFGTLREVPQFAAPAAAAPVASSSGASPADAADGEDD